MKVNVMIFAFFTFFSFFAFGEIPQTISPRMQHNLPIQLPNDSSFTLSINSQAGSVVIKPISEGESPNITLANYEQNIAYVDSKSSVQEMSIKVKYDADIIYQGMSIVVTVPKNIKIKIKTMSALVEVTGCENVNIKTMSGKIVVNKSNTVVAESMSGSISFNDNSGKCQGKTMIGSIYVSGQDEHKTTVSTMSGKVVGIPYVQSQKAGSTRTFYGNNVIVTGNKGTYSRFESIQPEQQEIVNPASVEDYSPEEINEIRLSFINMTSVINARSLTVQSIKTHDGKTFKGPFTLSNGILKGPGFSIYL